MQSMQKAAHDIRDAQQEQGKADFHDNNGKHRQNMDASRGQLSFWVQSAIAYDTRKVVDIEVLSKYCSLCSTWKSRLSKGSITQNEFDDWNAKHVRECEVTTTVSAPAMEMEAVRTIWKRSEEVNDLRYTVYLGDGDNKGYSAVAADKPYGETPIAKEECIGHVQKRL
eukprot:scpid108882/ scgid15095/ 